MRAPFEFKARAADDIELEELEDVDDTLDIELELKLVGFHTVFDFFTLPFLLSTVSTGECKEVDIAMVTGLLRLLLGVLLMVSAPIFTVFGNETFTVGKFLKYVTVVAVFTPLLLLLLALILRLALLLLLLYRPMGKKPVGELK